MESNVVILKEKWIPKEIMTREKKNSTFITQVVINLRYIVGHNLGWGNFSTVWLCWDLRDQRFVALKIVKSSSKATDAGLMEIEFLEEHMHDFVIQMAFIRTN
uniref:non-specific serine/threonine protein kinase n=1 Tax=Strigamia maritima TaxID=126957 RepID=T1J348_STRMM